MEIRQWAQTSLRSISHSKNRWIFRRTVVQNAVILEFIWDSLALWNPPNFNAIIPPQRMTYRISERSWIYDPGTFVFRHVGFYSMACYTEEPISIFSSALKTPNIGYYARDRRPIYSGPQHATIHCHRLRIRDVQFYVGGLFPDGFDPHIFVLFSCYAMEVNVSFLWSYF